MPVEGISTTARPAVGDDRLHERPRVALGGSDREGRERLAGRERADGDAGLCGEEGRAGQEGGEERERLHVGLRQYVVASVAPSVR